MGPQPGGLFDALLQLLTTPPHTFPADEGLRRVLEALHVRPDALLGHGGEAWVYALGDDRIVRVLHAGAVPGHVHQRQDLVDELASRSAPFALPVVLELGEVDGRYYAVERRLPGRSVLEQLRRLEGPDRDLLVEHHLDAAGALGSLHLEPRPWLGELIGDDPVRAPTWREYLIGRAAKGLRVAGDDFHHVDPVRLADALPDSGARAFLHLDAFAGNMLATGTTITAVLDIGLTSAIGDPRLDPVASAVYLAAPPITPVATPRDVEVANSWLQSAGLLDWLEPVRRWLAALWSFAVDDPNLHEWCRSVLGRR